MLCCLAKSCRGGERGLQPEGRGVTYNSFCFCLPLIAKLLFLREMQGGTLNQYFCGAFVNYALKSTNLSSPPHVLNKNPPLSLRVYMLASLLAVSTSFDFCYLNQCVCVCVCV